MLQKLFQQKTLCQAGEKDIESRVCVCVCVFEHLILLKLQIVDSSFVILFHKKHFKEKQKRLKYDRKRVMIKNGKLIPFLIRFL